MKNSAVLKAANAALRFVVSAIGCSSTAVALTLYVDVNNPAPVSPYTNWVSAATNIQDAVDAASTGDSILVTNGIYQNGGRKIYGALTNRVAVTQQLTLRSINGPAETVIQGNEAPTAPNDTNAVRCVYMTNGAVLAGFTLRNGSTRWSGNGVTEQCGGGAWCESTNAVISNCVFIANSAGQAGGGVFQGTLTNCSLTSNSAVGSYFEPKGGGAAVAALNHCTLTANSAVQSYFGIGGGVFSSTLNECVLIGNSAGSCGGGAYEGMLRNSLVASNSVTGAAGDRYGGGAYNSTLENCRIVANVSASVGGGVDGGILNNCTIEANSAKSSGGGAAGSILNNCLILGNSAGWGGGVIAGTANNCVILSNTSPYVSAGADVGTLNNCIVRYNFNAAGNEVNYQAYSFSYINYCCTVPLPTGNGHFLGNITNEPGFVDLFGGNLRLQSNAPCINAGANALAATTSDLDGKPRISGGTVDIGAYEFQNPASVISLAWLQQYGLPSDGSADYADMDADRMNNWQEWVSGTDPTNANSLLLESTPVAGEGGITVTWLSVTNRAYDVERSTDLGTHSSFMPLATNIAGLPGTTSYLDTTPPTLLPAFYRVRVRP